MKEQLNNDLKEALRNKDLVRRDTIRLLLTTLKNAEIEKGGELSQGEIEALLQKQAKQRRDSIDAFEEGGRTDLAERERAELEIIEEYLPEQMSEEQIREAVRAEIERQGASGPQDIGKVMGPLMARLRGKAEGAVVQRVARQELGK
ncbi:MAG: GatB/YqeY domain-containing protein [Chloroflexota bacterium]|nr:GatB/YqeY domain-containing protein [Chloroflexota bacterium]